MRHLLYANYTHDLYKNMAVLSMSVQKFHFLAQSISPALLKLQTLDSRCFLWFQQKTNKYDCYPLIRTISASGDGWLYALFGLTLIYLDYAKYGAFFYQCLLSFCFELPLYGLLKKRFRHNRPADYFDHFRAKILPSDQFSFPSGHTAAAFLMATQILLWFPQWAILAYVWASAIGLSRVLLGVHFPGDILAGAILGISASLLGAQTLTGMIS